MKPMIKSAEDFYDDLSSQYHLIATDWDNTVKKQGKILSDLFGKLANQSRPFKVLDCSCGIGTQAIGLALEGNIVTASDISRKAVERAKAEAKRFKIDVNFLVSDFRKLSQDISGEFDFVVTADNSLPHLLTESDLSLAAKNIFHTTNSGGSAVISMRDYDQIRATGIQGMPPRRITDEHGTRVYLQTWQWNQSKTIYDLELFILKQASTGWIAESYITSYRAWLRSEIEKAFLSAGFVSLKWWTPEESGFYQPILTALKKGSNRGAPYENK